MSQPLSFLFIQTDEGLIYGMATPVTTELSHIGENALDQTVGMGARRTNRHSGFDETSYFIPVEKASQKRYE